MEDEGDDENWRGITDDDILAVDLEYIAEEASSSVSIQTTKKRHLSGSSEQEDAELPEKIVKFDEGWQAEESSPPIHSLRGGYLWVSDLCSQMWCEQQLEYRLSLPPDDNIPEPEQVTKGSSLHLARELEVQDYVNVTVTSSEDIFAVKVLNLLIVLKSILTQSSDVHREVPIFGVVDGVFIIGKIDEIRVDRETFHLDIVDLKTRRTKKPPGRAQKATHNTQVMLYKHLFDDLIRGLIPRHSLMTTLKLDLEQTLGESVTSHISSGLTSILDGNEKNRSWTLSHLLDHLKNAAESLPFINQLFIDYVWQEDEQTFLIEEVKYDDIWLRSQMTKCMRYWRGERECQGVDIEDAWKCHSCDYQESCSWVAKKIKELQQARAAKNAMLSQ
ncbi:exonuclease V-like isoform X1 [Panulirus ornatus]|uniref:exonuclease V-like isoform X1 n=1 Tax=Panulirus ornatus TaxID=150431 RepID=UPI003A84D0BC